MRQTFSGFGNVAQILVDDAKVVEVSGLRLGHSEFFLDAQGSLEELERRVVLAEGPKATPEIRKLVGLALDTPNVFLDLERSFVQVNGLAYVMEPLVAQAKIIEVDGLPLEIPDPLVDT